MEIEDKIQELEAQSAAHRFALAAIIMASSDQDAIRGVIDDLGDTLVEQGLEVPLHKEVVAELQRLRETFADLERL